tara:strand:+ start:441 stop:899 length:459 start_codon:yes stop_codon:yes gene_type:complete
MDYKYTTEERKEIKRSSEKLFTTYDVRELILKVDEVRCNKYNWLAFFMTDWKGGVRTDDDIVEAFSNNDPHVEYLLEKFERYGRNGKRNDLEGFFSWIDSGLLLEIRAIDKAGLQELSLRLQVAEQQKDLGTNTESVSTIKVNDHFEIVHFG